MATGAGTGYFPYFPGTVGTLVAIPLSLAVNRTATVSLFIPLSLLAALTLSAAWLCKRGEEILGEKDCQKIVVDEIAGFLLANFLSPPEFRATLMAFLLFRFFDIIKPFPVARLESLKGGMGIILDDLSAGLYTLLILRLLSLGGLL